MRLNFFCILCLFFLVPSISTAQQFSFGPVNGINLSNIRGDLKYDQWKARPGPVNGLFLKTPLLGNWLSVRTGAEYISFYYKRQQTPTYYPNEFWRMNGLPGPGSSVVPENSIIMPPYYTTNTIDWHFLRIPLMLEWKTPGRISFGFGAGAHYSFLMNDEFTGKDKELKSDEYREENFPQSTDWGWILSSSLSYQVNNQWNLFLEGRTTWGKEVYMENPERKNGASELLFGVGYSPFTRQKTSRFGTFTGERIELLPHAGISFSNSTHEDEKKHYATLPGFNTGISVKYKTDSVFSFISGA